MTLFRVIAPLCLATPALAQDSAPQWRAPATPTIARQPMSFSSGDIKLAGTLYLPEHGDRVPAVVVLWGAQAPTREYSLYKQLAAGLPALDVRRSGW
jgi:hypothetical protein